MKESRLVYTALSHTQNGGECRGRKGGRANGMKLEVHFANLLLPVTKMLSCEMHGYTSKHVGMGERKKKTTQCRLSSFLSEDFSSLCFFFLRYIFVRKRDTREKGEGNIRKNLVQSC